MITKGEEYCRLDKNAIIKKYKKERKNETRYDMRYMRILHECGLP